MRWAVRISASARSSAAGDTESQAVQYEILTGAAYIIPYPLFDHIYCSVTDVLVLIILYQDLV